MGEQGFLHWCGDKLAAVNWLIVFAIVVYGGLGSIWLWALIDWITS